VKCEIIDLGLVHYKEGDRVQLEILDRVKSFRREHALIFCEFFPVYTSGRAGSLNNLLISMDFLQREGIEFYNISRGGNITGHNPGQIVVYPIFNLSCFTRLRPDLNWYLRSLEEVVIDTLGDYGISAARKNTLTGVWVGEKKISSIGISVSRWTTYHGLSLNVNNDLSFFEFIIPCGIKGCEMTSLSQLINRPVDIKEIKHKIAAHFARTFELELHAEAKEAVLA
jgi:lipoate-protein ligase B